MLSTIFKLQTAAVWNVFGFFMADTNVTMATDFCKCEYFSCVDKRLFTCVIYITLNVQGMKRLMPKAWKGHGWRERSKAGHSCGHDRKVQCKILVHKVLHLNRPVYIPILLTPHTNKFCTWSIATVTLVVFAREQCWVREPFCSWSKALEFVAHFNSFCRFFDIVQV